MLLGVISDTHGLLRPEAIEALRGSAMIIHAGDVGKAAVLEQLRSISSVIAVRGNIDTEPWAATLPETAIVAAGTLAELMLIGVASRQSSSLVSADEPADRHLEGRSGSAVVGPGFAPEQKGWSRPNGEARRIKPRPHLAPRDGH